MPHCHRQHSRLPGIADQQQCTISVRSKPGPCLGTTTPHTLVAQVSAVKVPKCIMPYSQRMSCRAQIQRIDSNQCSSLLTGLPLSLSASNGDDIKEQSKGQTHSPRGAYRPRQRTTHHKKRHAYAKFTARVQPEVLNKACIGNAP
jgi:hypothetical protein